MEEYGWIKITDIKPHPENPRNHDDKQIKKIASSIDKLGWGRPITPIETKTPTKIYKKEEEF